MIAEHRSFAPGDFAMLPLMLLALSAAPVADPPAPPPPPAPPATPAQTEKPKCSCDASMAACAASASSPFSRLPCVNPIDPCTKADCLTECKDKTKIWKHTFHKAAQFPFPRFNQQGCQVPDDGLLIYEGMTLTVDESTGNFEVAFVATAPQIPVVLRLQLAFYNPKLPLPNDPNYQSSISSPYTRITLPPMRIESDPKAKPGDITGNTVRINHRGQSDLFKAVKAGGESIDLSERKQIVFPPIAPDNGWSVRRDGVARFGSGVAASDDINP
jgi:hypothetical protein